MGQVFEHPSDDGCIFCASLCTLKNKNKKEAEKIFEDLNLSKKSTYKTNANIKKELDGYTIELIVNEVGCGIFIY